MITQPQCGEPGYERCSDCQAHRTEPHLAGCPVLGRTRCYWCDAPMYDGPRPHDLIDCRTRQDDALTDCPDCGGPHPAPCVYRDESAAWRLLGTPIAPAQLRQIDDQRKDRA